MKIHNWLRSIVFVGLLIAVSMMPWDIVSKQEVRPFDMIRPFTTYLFDKFSGKGSQSTYKQVLEVFTATPELRFLAIPPKLGGPVNQSTYVVLGFSFVITMRLIKNLIVIFQ